MLSVLIECGADAGGLGASLAALVPGAVEGLVRDVVVIDGGMDDAAREVADHAGCRIVSTLAEAVAKGKGDWLLLLEPGARLSSEWIEDVSRHLSGAAGGATPKAARFSRSSRDRPRFLQRLKRQSALSSGLLLPKAQALGRARRCRSLEEMGRGLAATRLAATIRPRV